MPQLKPNVAEALNLQLGREFAAANQYLAMAVYFDSRSLDELAGFFYRQADEERMHGMKILRYLLDSGEAPTIPELPRPKNEFSSAEDVAVTSLEQERQVTAWVHELVDLAASERDHTTRNFLQWFVDEQLEEEATFGKLLDIIRMSDNILLVEQVVARLDPHVEGEQ